jgi:hypothetical protein
MKATARRQSAAYAAFARYQQDYARNAQAERLRWMEEVWTAISRGCNLPRHIVVATTGHCLPVVHGWRVRSGTGRRAQARLKRDLAVGQPCATLWVNSRIINSAGRAAAIPTLTIIFPCAISSAVMVVPSPISTK